MTLSQSIIATLSYHDIFDYPLTREESHQYLINNQTSQSRVESELSHLHRSSKIGQIDQYYFLKGRSKIVKLRRQRVRHSRVKFKKAYFFAQVLKIIPSLKLVAISGALAMQNSHKNDDTDLVLITSKGTLWTTRFLSNFLLLPFKRDSSGQKISNRACLNVFIEESNLKISPQNLYLAHEIYQMKPLWERDNFYQRFLKANTWIKKFLPNWQPSSQFTLRQSQGDAEQSRSITVHSSLIQKPSTINHQPSTVENFLRSFQLWYMRPKLTTERIAKHQLFFHPQNTGEWVMGEYQKRLMKFTHLQNLHIVSREEN